MERILRQQKEARLAAAAEAERLTKEREKAQQAVSPHLPSDVEKASLLSGNTPTLTQTLVPPATGGVFSGNFNRHLQNLRRRTGLGSNENQPLAKLENKPAPDASPTPPPLPRLDNKSTHLPSPVAPTVGNKPASDSHGHSSPPPPITKPLPLKPPLSSDYSLNEQYLSSAKASQSQIPGLSLGEEYMPGTFPPIANDVHRDVNSRPTPLSDICRYLFFSGFLSD